MYYILSSLGALTLHSMIFYPCVLPVCWIETSKHLQNRFPWLFWTKWRLMEDEVATAFLCVLLFQSPTNTANRHLCSQDRPFWTHKKTFQNRSSVSSTTVRIKGGTFWTVTLRQTNHPKSGLSLPADGHVAPLGATYVMFSWPTEPAPQSTIHNLEGANPCCQGPLSVRQTMNQLKPKITN